MLLQRLTLDSVRGFNFDYMGSPTYTLEARYNGQEALAKALLAGILTTKHITFTELNGLYAAPPVAAVAIGASDTLTYISEEFAPFETDRPFRLYDANVVAWLLVNKDPLMLYHPLLIVRESVADPMAKMGRFLSPIVHSLQRNISTSDAA